MDYISEAYDTVDRSLFLGAVTAEVADAIEHIIRIYNIMDKDIDKLYLLHDTSTYDLACEVEAKIKKVFTEAYNSKGGEQ